ncbi:hypothetical protein F3Y22_tig00110339pilonHSYRG00155 [Hibiscus syriacus]|uniref:Uncharacterized protein n=1 Tax=Hibiscus syriacus TaxID=106335 RepID=A0A6A3AUT4_HIBSY|nr:hypothetical protein F3Y22_tig00110339pilonHSYRG00155 [Hibiscus syriacus]
MNVFQKLVACIIWVGKLDCCPHAQLMAPTHWEEFTKEITKQFCSLEVQSYLSPSNISIAASVEGLPTLLKLANVVAAKRQEWQEMEQLPMLEGVGEELQFHSTVECPVSRDQDRTKSTNANAFSACSLQIICVYTCK